MQSDNLPGSADTRKKVLTNNNYLYHKYMERIYLGISCDTAGVDDAIIAEAFLGVLKTETGKRIFRIVTQRINKKGYRMNVDNEGRTDH